MSTSLELPHCRDCEAEVNSAGTLCKSCRARRAVRSRWDNDDRTPAERSADARAWALKRWVGHVKQPPAKRGVWKAGKPHGPPPPCRFCGGLLTSMKSTTRTCKAIECKRQAHRERERARYAKQEREGNPRRPPTRPAQCLDCGKAFDTRLTTSRCHPCSARRAMAEVNSRSYERFFWDRIARNWEKRLRRLPVLFVGPKPFVSPPIELPERHPARQDWTKSTGLTFVFGWCAICGDSFMAATGRGEARYCSKRCQRRAHKKTNRVTGRTRREVYERDGWRCHLCQKVIPARYRDHPTHRLGPTIDHLVPRSKGGGDEESNLATAHRICNSAKGADAANDQMRLAV